MSPRLLSPIVLILLLAFAFALRVYELDAIPLGFHGDEALTALDAMWILEEGWIGPYVYPSGLGQPTGPLYFVAIVFWLLEPSVFSVRLAMALIGVSAVLFTYLAAREMTSVRIALIAAFLFAVMRWHLHLSRTGLMLGAWPAVFAATLWLLFSARRTQRTTLYAAAGLMAGLGVYSYNAYILTFPVLATVFVADAFFESRAPRNTLVFWALALLASIPMLVFIAQYPDAYFYHHQVASLSGSEPWQTAGWGSRLGLLGERASDWLVGLFFGGRPDGDDGTASLFHPPVGPFVSVCAAAGLAMAPHVLSRAAAAVLFASILIFPFGGILTTGDGIFRRSFALAPILCIAAAISLDWLWSRRGKIGPALVGALLTASTCFNVFGYFLLDQESPDVWNAFAVEFREAAEVMATMPKDARVYFYSSRWSVDYPPRLFLAPHVEAYDRSEEFGSGNRDIEVPATFFFLDRYLDRIDEIEKRFPDGERNVARYDGREVLRLYHVE